VPQYFKDYYKIKGRRNGNIKRRKEGNNKESGEEIKEPGVMQTVQ
jgi:hypothetical protein